MKYEIENDPPGVYCNTFGLGTTPYGARLALGEQFGSDPATAVLKMRFVAILVPDMIPSLIAQLTKLTTPETRQ